MIGESRRWCVFRTLPLMVLAFLSRYDIRKTFVLPAFFRELSTRESDFFPHASDVELS